MIAMSWPTPQVQQAAFRAVLDAFARPGALVRTQGDSAALTLLSLLLDETVGFADPQRLLAHDTRRRLLAHPAPPEQARFILCDGRHEPGDWQPFLGTLEAPELGATLVLTVDALASDDRAARPAVDGADAVRLRLEGPGVPTARWLAVTGIDRAWFERRAVWVSAFPLGVDLVLAAPKALAALPRTTRVAFEER